MKKGFRKPILKDYDGDVSKKMLPVKKYAGLNNSNDINKRYKVAEEKLKEWESKLKSGYVKPQENLVFKSDQFIILVGEYFFCINFSYLE